MTQLALFELADSEPRQRDRRSPWDSPPSSGCFTAYHTADVFPGHSIWPGNERTLPVFTNGRALPPSVELCAEGRAWLRAALVNPYTES